MRILDTSEWPEGAKRRDVTSEIWPHAATGPRLSVKTVEAKPKQYTQRADAN